MVLIGEEASVKRVYQDQNGLRLVPENSDYQETVYSIDEIENTPILILGRVIANRIQIK